MTGSPRISAAPNAVAIVTGASQGIDGGQAAGH